MKRINLFTIAIIAIMTITKVSGQINEIYEEPNNLLIFFNKKFKTKYSSVKKIYPGFYKFSPETDKNNPGAMMKFGIIDKDNNILVEPKYEMFYSHLKSGIITIWSLTEQKEHLYSLKTKSMLYRDIKKISSYRDFLINKHIIFKFDNSIGAFDSNGNLVYEPIYKKILINKGIVYLLKNKILTNSENKNKITKVKDFKLSKDGILVNKKNDLYNFDLSDLK